MLVEETESLCLFRVSFVCFVTMFNFFVRNVVCALFFER